jgi:hypothetical protein
MYAKGGKGGDATAGITGSAGTNYGDGGGGGKNANYSGGAGKGGVVVMRGEK